MSDRAIGILILAAVVAVALMVATIVGVAIARGGICDDGERLEHRYPVGRCVSEEQR